MAFAEAVTKASRSAWNAMSLRSGRSGIVFDPPDFVPGRYSFLSCECGWSLFNSVLTVTLGSAERIAARGAPESCLVGLQLEFAAPIGGRVQQFSLAVSGGIANA